MMICWLVCVMCLCIVMCRVLCLMCWDMVL